ncbi:MAG: J domain-containing protein [Bradyrhizobium sp.]|uniref:J domain-containing protein n=1 Tax=Bradyrhizobium sp. TaxID=376 RepID=UPI001212DD7F|nr:J domain-containing protein [Bradyrhizobium sp.]THD73574.1 MAG: J domain-containing protein [Bradyrhizobium sp.]
MKTLYDLLEALPGDDAEDLRAAFRRAVKGAHPDMRPGDPDAALKFREIVRASEILGDTEQRAVYDDLLQLARLEQKSLGHPFAARMRKIVAGMSAITWAATVTGAGYFMFMYMSAAPVASIISSGTAAAFPPKSEHRIVSGEPVVTPAVLAESSPEADPASDADAAADLAASETKSRLAEGLSACGNSDLKLRLADMDDVFQLDTKLMPAYVDPGVIFYRTEKSDSVFPDIAGAKRIEKAGRAKSAPTTSRKRPFAPAAITTSVIPLPLRRMTAQDSARGGETMASAVRLR